MNFDPNVLYYQMVKYYNDHRNDEDKVIFCNEGSSRSSKTWDFIHFVVTYCDHNRGKKKDIYFLRDTLIHCKDFTMKEVEKCFAVIGIPFNPTQPQKPNLNLWGNNIYFRGLDEESKAEGYPSHVAFVNEALDLNSYRQISGILMRCEDVFAMDWNPKISDHWAYGFEKRPNCLFTHSTYKNNKHLPQTVINEIDGYNPWHPDDSHLPEKQRRPHPTNIENGTADDYRHKVYALGIRASLEGLIFRDITWIDEFPTNIERISHGLDFGFTNSPTALMKVGKEGQNLYLQKLIYSPTESAAPLAEAIKALNIDTPIWADSADKYQGGPGMISDLRLKGIKCYGVNKFVGSIMYGIDLMKQHKIHVVRDADLQREFNNYKWREVHGITVNEPIDDFNHAIDAARYACLSSFRK